MRCAEALVLNQVAPHFIEGVACNNLGLARRQRQRPLLPAQPALERRLRYPLMFEQYAKLCADAKLDIGRLWIYRAPERWVLNFPTKKHWRYPSCGNRSLLNTQSTST